MKPLDSKTVWRTVLSKPLSWIILILVSGGFFTFNVGLKNYRTLESLATESGLGASLTFLAVLVQGFHHTVTLSSYSTLIIISILTGVVVMLLAFKTQALRSKKIGLSSSAGIVLGVIAPGCATWVGLAALFGITGSLIAILPLKGLEISLGAIALLGLAIHNLTQGLRACDLCKVEFQNKTAERRSTHNGRKNSSWKYACIALIGVLIIAGAILFFNKGSVTGNVVNNGNTGSISAKALMDDDAVLGSANAPVTIVQFTDWQCPFCRRFETDTFAQLKQNYIDTGKVKFVTRDFPLESIHPGALPAAIAGECIQEEAGDEAYYAFKQKVNEEQNIRDSGSAKGAVTKTVTFTNEDLSSWAQTLGYDITSCLESQTYAAEVRKDLSDGQAAGVRGTPAFLIINKKGTSTLLSGAQPFSAFKAELDKALA